LKIYFFIILSTITLIVKPNNPHAIPNSVIIGTTIRKPLKKSIEKTEIAGSVTSNPNVLSGTRYKELIIARIRTIIQSCLILFLFINNPHTKDIKMTKSQGQNKRIIITYI